MIKTSLTSRNSKVFTAWLKKFSVISNEGILEINYNKNIFEMKNVNTDKSVIKSSNLSFQAAEFVTTESDGYIRAGIRVLPKLAKMVDNFNGEDFNMIIECEDSEPNEASIITLSNKSLKIKLNCASLSTIKFISNDTFENSVAVTDDPYTFTLSNTVINEIKSVSTFDNDNIYIMFDKKEDVFVVKGGSFELIIDDDVKTSELRNIYISKEQFSQLDIESYAVEMGEDRMVFRSLDSNTTTVIAKYDMD
ncbi:MAG: hypothetical protein RSC92_00905 [Clostridia bacterium]